MRHPSSVWEYAASAADQLLRWHAHGTPDRMEEPRHTRAVVLLAAAINNEVTEADAGLAPPAAVLAVELANADRAVDAYAASALQLCPATPGVGLEERDALLTLYGTTEYSAVETHVREALAAHIADADNPQITIHGRRDALISRW
ncbi:hypothetical protein OG897_39890 [Streptomyces sp. NBC_00237]|uniref:hypothetical protein n=1 Tax=Streptomyces sp. NBC_00237 TaxID=2975687 RepID=UPI0022579F50|nr:hypothetical protein [Streptomyces sp. NBC_00237]MCX5207554.1 hypothetical protein [Streptomyces sp. NBC_00237]